MKLQINQLNGYYGRAHILHDLSLRVEAGEVVALLGRNGAGKSTTFRAVAGLLSRKDGQVLFDGQDISNLAAHQIGRLGVGYVPEDRRIFSTLTVEENLSVGRQPARGNSTPWTPERLFALFPNLAEMMGRSAGNISGGEQQMLTIARTLMGNPSLILLDEPSEGLAPTIVNQMAESILEMRRLGVSVLLSEQNLHFARMISDRAYIIEKGAIRFDGTVKELEANEEVRSAYLAV